MRDLFQHRFTDFFLRYIFRNRGTCCMPPTTWHGVLLYVAFLCVRDACRCCAQAVTSFVSLATGRGIPCFVIILTTPNGTP